MTEEGFKAAEDAIDSAMALLHQAEHHGELKLIADEFENAAKMLLLGVSIGRDRLGLPPGRIVYLDGIVAEHCRLWLARNRPGGLGDSVKRLGPCESLNGKGNNE
jgi:hypothetical protein